MRNTFLRGGAGIQNDRAMQKLSSVRQDGRTDCPKSGCEKYEKGYDIPLNLNDPEDMKVLKLFERGHVKQKYELRQSESAPQMVFVHFFPGQPCLGHRRVWAPDLSGYFADQRTVRLPEFEERFEEGGRALVAATELAMEMGGQA